MVSERSFDARHIGPGCWLCVITGARSSLSIRCASCSPQAAGSSKRAVGPAVAHHGWRRDTSSRRAMSRPRRTRIVGIPTLTLPSSIRQTGTKAVQSTSPTQVDPDVDAFGAGGDVGARVGAGCPLLGAMALSSPLTHRPQRNR